MSVLQMVMEQLKKVDFDNEGLDLIDGHIRHDKERSRLVLSARIEVGINLPGDAIESGIGKLFGRDEEDEEFEEDFEPDPLEVGDPRYGDRQGEPMPEELFGMKKRAKQEKGFDFTDELSELAEEGVARGVAGILKGALRRKKN